MIIKVRMMSTNERDTIIRQKNLQQCNKGDAVYWESGKLANLDNLHIKIAGNIVTIKTSIHKLHELWCNSGKLENSGGFSMEEAQQTILMLFDDLSLSVEQAVVTYFELGLSMPMAHDPDDYIAGIRCVSEKEMFNDANFVKGKQHTSEKSRNIKKVMKIYNKTYEAEDRGREGVPSNILRIETMMRRQNVRLTDFFDEAYVCRLGQRFYNDWMNVVWYRSIVAVKGVKMSMVDKAKELLRLGREAYYSQSLAEYKAKTITKKQWETIRTFIQKWDELKGLFTLVPGELELEYQNAVLTHCSKNLTNAPYGAFSNNLNNNTLI